MASNESHILVINSGSSSLKFTVFDPASEEVLASGIAERLGTDGAGLKLVDLAQKRHDEGHRWPTIGPHSFESLNS